MKHFIGGFTLGVALAVRYLPEKRGVGGKELLVAHLISGILGGIIAWGLLP